MPVKKSAFKRLRQDKKKHLRNKAAISEIRTLSKRVTALINDNKLDEAVSTLKKLESKLDKTAKSKIIRKGNASRRKSRLKAQLDKKKKA